MNAADRITSGLRPVASTAIPPREERGKPQRVLAAEPGTPAVEPPGLKLLVSIREASGALSISRAQLY